MIEIWRQVIRNGQAIEGFYVSDHGNIVRLTPKKFKVLKKHDHVFKERGNFQTVSILGKTEKVHRLVAETFISLDEFPPIRKEDWDITPQSARDLIKSGLYVDHIDCNPFNNHVNNLRWVTPRRNNSHIKKRELEDVL